MNETLFWVLAASVNFILASVLFAMMENAREENAFLRDSRDAYRATLIGARKDLDAAMKQIAALKRQTAGRDKTGRFTKRPKDSEVHGSE